MVYICFLLTCVCFCCVSVNFRILVCVFGLLAFPCCLSGLCCYLLVISCSVLNIGLLLHAAGNLTSIVIEQYSAAGC
jgi:hypothetical protein